MLQGKASRSLQAAYKLINEGGMSTDQVMHVERGLYGWYQADLPIEGGGQWLGDTLHGMPGRHTYLLNISQYVCPPWTHATQLLMQQHVQHVVPAIVTSCKALLGCVRSPHCAAGWPAAGDYSPDVGRTPMAAAEPTLQQVAQSVGYEMKEVSQSSQQQQCR